MFFQEIGSFFQEIGWLFSALTGRKMLKKEVYAEEQAQVKNMIYACVHIYKNQEVAVRQQASIKAYAEENAVSIDQWFSFDRNGRKKLSVLRSGDVLLISKLFRLGSDVHEIMNTLRELLGRGVVICSCEDGLRLGDDMMTAVMSHCFKLAGEVAKDVRAQLTREALEIRKKSGKKLGRPLGSLNRRLLLSDRVDEIERLLAEGNSKSKIARLLNVDNATLNRFLKRISSGQKEIIDVR